MPVEKHAAGVIAKENFKAVIDVLLGKYRLIGPTRVDGEERYAVVKSSHDLQLNLRNSNLSPKAIFFPQTEPLFYFDETSNGMDISRDKDESVQTLTLIIGLRPCDALAISLLDKVFKESEPGDPYYTKRRQSTRIITMVCCHAEPTCFCTTVGCGPDAATGSDILCYELDGRYLLEAQSAEGDELMDAVSDVLTPVTRNDREEARLITVDVKSRMETDIDVGEMRKKLEDFDASWWERFCEKCLGCGICTYLCPTCHCFDISDEVVKDHGRRVRTWDSCQFPLFTLHASGHNPRPDKKERVRQRIMHKFSYTSKYYDSVFCVGCGRCILCCPVNMDIRKIMRQIAEVS